MNPIECFWLEPTCMAWRGLRCYVGSSKCRRSGYGYHDMVVPCGEVKLRGIDEYGYHSAPPARRRRGDPPWPLVCKCGHDMSKDRALRKQVIEARVYETADGRRYTLTYRLPSDAPDGAMWDATWLHSVRTGPDRMSLMVRCPRRQDWPVDLAASSGGYWTRTGDPRAGTVTANPSIAIGLPGTVGFFHGWLQNGWLRDNGDSRAKARVATHRKREG